MRKVELTAEQAQALEHAKTVHTFEHIMWKLTDGGFDHYDKKCNALDVLGAETVATALIVGYTIKQTPEEQIAELYKESRERILKLDGNNEIEAIEYEQGFQEGVHVTLETFGINVTGINALYAGK